MAHLKDETVLGDACTDDAGTIAAQIAVLSIEEELGPVQSRGTFGPPNQFIHSRSPGSSVGMVSPSQSPRKSPLAAPQIEPSLANSIRPVKAL